MGVKSIVKFSKTNVDEIPAVRDLRKFRYLKKDGDRFLPFLLEKFLITLMVMCRRDRPEKWAVRGAPLLKEAECCLNDV